MLVIAISTYFCLGELPELAQTLISKKNGARPIQLGRFSLLQSSASRSQFWLPELAFQKGSQQLPDFHVWSIFSLSAGYLAFGGCRQASKSGHSKHNIFTSGAYFGFRQDIWVLGVASRLPKVVTANTKSLRLEHILIFGRSFWRGVRSGKMWFSHAPSFLALAIDYSFI